MLPESVANFSDVQREFLVADADDLRAVHFPSADREFAYPNASYEVRVSPDGVNDALITVTAGTLVRDLLLQADRLDAHARTDHGRVTLLPGESTTWRVTGWAQPDAEAARAALYSVNGGGEVRE